VAERLLRKGQVCERLGISPVSLWRRVRDGKFPRPVVINRDKRGAVCLVAWPESEVDAWVAARIAEARS
jgi:prophage regulatory protein